MDFWNKVPAFRLLLPFLLGIIPGIYINISVTGSTAFIVSFFAIIVFIYFYKPLYSKYKYRHVFGSIVSLFLFFCGYVLTVEKTERHSPKHFSNTYKIGDWVIVKVADPSVEKAKSYKLEVEVLSVKDSNNWINTNGHAMIYLQKDSIATGVDYGDILYLKPTFQEISPPKNPNEYNYKRYLYYHNIYHQSYVARHSWFATDKNDGNSIYLAAHQLRKYLLSVLKEHGFSGNEFSVASALVLGYKDELDKGLVRAYSSAGATHVLAVSGLHVGIIYLIISFLLKFMERRKQTRIIKTIIIIGLLWFYALLTGLSPSVMRASVMFTFVAIGTATGRYTNIYNTLAASAFALLLWQPYLLVEVGFQLSYLAVLGIVFIQPKLYKLWVAPNWLMDKIWGITAVSIAAQIATFPLGVLYFHQFPNYFLFSNLIVIPMAMLILCTGIVVFVTSPIPIVCGFFAKVLWCMVWFLNAAVKFIEQLPFSITEGISITILETYGIYIFIAFLLAFVTQISIKYLRSALYILIALFGWNLYESYLQNQQQKLIVYNVTNELAIDFINGKQHYFLSKKDLLTDEDKMLFHIKHNWWDEGLNSASFINPDQKKVNEKWLLKRKNFIQFGKTTVVIIDKNYQPKFPKQKTQVDYVILSNGTRAKLEQLQNEFEFKKIILASNNPWWMEKQWEKIAEEKQIPLHYIKNEGAFIVEL